MGSVAGIFDPGNMIVSAPYYISGKSGALTVPAAASPIATLVNFGRVDPKVGPALLDVPLRISQAEMCFLLTSGATGTVGFEVYKGAITVQRTTGGNTFAAVRKKTQGYDAIPTSEVSLYVSDTGATSGGAFTPEGGPLKMVGGGTAATFGVAAGGWTPLDLCGVSVEKGEGLEVRVTQALSAVGIFMVRFDFTRQ